MVSHGIVTNYFKSPDRMIDKNFFFYTFTFVYDNNVKKTSEPSSPQMPPSLTIS